MRALIVLGMHRSGTSAVARVCNLLGADVGEHLMPPREGINPTGFWELEEIRVIHDELLQSLGSSWDATEPLPAGWWQAPDFSAYKARLINVVQREFKNSEFICLKDPRMCRLAPLWNDIFEELAWVPHYLLTVRNPLEVARSLEARDGFHQCKSHLLWLRHVLEAERWTRGRIRAFVSYEQMVVRWRDAILPAWQQLGLGQLKPDAITKRRIEGFLQKDLRHHWISRDGLESDNSHLFIRRVYDGYASAVRNNEQAQTAFSDLEEALTQTAFLFEPVIAAERSRKTALATELHSVNVQINAMTGEVNRLTHELAAASAQANTRLAEIKRLSQEAAARENLVAEQGKVLAEQRNAMAEQGKVIAEQRNAMAEQGKVMAEQGKVMAEQGKVIAEQRNAMAEQGKVLAEQRNAMAEQGKVLAEQGKVMAEQVNTIAEQSTAITALLSSTSWRITAPIRAIMGIARSAGGGIKAKSAYYLRRLFIKLPIDDNKKLKLRSYITTGTQLVQQLTGSNDAAYQNWIARYDTLDDFDRNAIKRHIDRLAHRPLISVIMPVFNTPERFLRDALESVLGQLYSHWELCIADDCSTDAHLAEVIREYEQRDGRIRAVFRDENGNISASSNSALALASGEFVALMDHDDVIPTHALYMVAVAINEHPDGDVIYSDEDKIDGNGQRSQPYFKSDWNPDLFYAQNMINHLGVYRTTAIRAASGFRLGFEGSQDYDLILRIMERTAADKIIHIPHVLYHWRMASSLQSFSRSQLPRAVSSARRALQEHLDRSGIKATVHGAHGASHYQRVRRAVPSPEPLVSIIVPTRDKAELLRQCIDGLLTKTRYAAFEVIIVDNGSVEPQTHDYLRVIQDDVRVRVLGYDREFNYSAINNFAIDHAKGELICLLNNDIVVINDAWLNELVSHGVRPEVGAVGAMLYYPDDTIQHAGIITGIGGVAGHSHKGFQRGEPGYFGRLHLVHNVSGVTGACLLTRREVLDKCGGLDEVNLKVAFNDVDLCLRIREHGYLIVWTPHAELYHLESASRGPDTATDKVGRFRDEVLWMQKRWATVLQKDPYYNENLTLEHSDFSLAFPPRVRKPWHKLLTENDTVVAEKNLMQVVDER